MLPDLLWIIPLAAYGLALAGPRVAVWAMRRQSRAARGRAARRQLFPRK